MARRGAELLPTARMVWSRSIADAVIAAASAGGVGIALSCVIMLLAALGGASDALQPIGLSILAVVPAPPLATMILWSLAAFAGMGLVLGEDVVATSSGRTLGLMGILVLWVVGLSLLTWLRVRLERLGPLLREEFGYDVRVRTASGDSSPGLV
jgi:hypothetical protein